jgi:hypothetical protein
LISKPYNTLNSLFFTIDTHVIVVVAVTNQTLLSPPPHAMQTSLSSSFLNGASYLHVTTVVLDPPFATIVPVSNTQHVITLKLMNTNYIY